MTEYENAAIANRAKTARLKALRLARDAQEAAELAANPPPPAKKKKTARRKKRPKARPSAPVRRHIVTTNPVCVLGPARGCVTSLSAICSFIIV